MFSDYKEIIGLIASFVILVALIMPNIKALRIINTFGAIIMVVYGILILKIPVIIMNTGSALINIYYLFKMFTHKSEYLIIKTNDKEEYYNYISKDLKGLNANELYVLILDDKPVKYLSFINLEKHVEVNNFKGVLSDKEMVFINNYIGETLKTNKEILYLNLSQ